MAHPIDEWSSEDSDASDVDTDGNVVGLIDDTVRPDDRDVAGVDVRNIVTGRRRRRPRDVYVDENWHALLLEGVHRDDAIALAASYDDPGEDVDGSSWSPRSESTDDDYDDLDA